MAELVTLSGDYSMRPLTRRQVIYMRRAEREELMGGSYLDYLKSTGKFIISPVVAPIKGAGHFLFEAGRGIKTGDISRILKSPFKGAGKVVGEIYRPTSKYAEYYWRPSKMRVWMKPTGAVCTAAGTITAATPAAPIAPFLFACGAILTVGGTVGEGIYQKNKKPTPGEDEEDRKKKATQNLMWLGVASIAGIGLIMTLT